MVDKHYGNIFSLAFAILQKRTLVTAFILILLSLLRMFQTPLPFNFMFFVRFQVCSHKLCRSVSVITFSFNSNVFYTKSTFFNRFKAYLDELRILVQLWPIMIKSTLIILSTLLCLIAPGVTYVMLMNLDLVEIMNSRNRS